MATQNRLINPAVPNLPLGTREYEQRYQDQFTNILRLYFNQLNTASGTQTTNATILQDEINALTAAVDLATQRNQTLIWLGM